MDTLNEDQFEDSPDPRMPDEVVDVTMLDGDIPRTEYRRSAAAIKQEEDEDSPFVHIHEVISPELSQARIKPDPGAGEVLERHIKVEEGLNDGNLQEVSTGTRHGGNRKGDPILISDDEDMPQGDWKVRENQNGRIRFQRRSQLVASKDLEPDIDAQNTAALELAMDDLRDWKSRRDSLEDKLCNNPGTETDRLRLEQLNKRMRDARSKIHQLRSGKRAKIVKNEELSGSVSIEKTNTLSKTDNSRARNAREWWERRYESQKDAIARKRNALYGMPLPANLNPLKRRSASDTADTGFKRVFGNRTSDERNEARRAVQNLPEAGEIFATTKDQQLKQTLADASKHGDKKANGNDAVQLELASRSFGLKKCKPDNSNWASAKWILEGINSRLYNHQILGVHWMVGREIGQDHGGINADEMGLGKTVQTLSCIAHNMPKPTEPRTTLIVAPASAIPQWMSEIPKHLPTGPDFTYTHFKNGLSETEDNLGGHAIIMVSYQALLKSYRLFNADSKDKQSASSRRKRRDQLPKGHIGVLFKMQFWRVVLDEAHAIKNHASKTSIACRNLKAKHRWALSGTPIQNSPEGLYPTLELWPYLAFLQVPWANSLDRFRQMLGNVVHPSNVNRLSSIVKEVMICRTTGDTILGQPLWKAKTSHSEIKWIEHTKEEQIIYRCVEDSFRERINENLRRSGENPKLKDMSLYLLFFLRLRQATAHPFLLEQAFKKNFSKEDIDVMNSKLDRIGQQKPVWAQLKLSFEEGMQDRQQFGASRFGYEFDMKDQLGMAMATKNDDLCKLCLAELVDPQKNSCGHIFCLFCIENEDDRATARRAKAICPLCEERLQDWEPVPSQQSSLRQELFDQKRAKYEAMDLDDEEIEALLNRKQQKDLKARQGPAKKGRDGKSLGNDYLDIQPHLRISTSGFLRALDEKYPTPMVPSAKTTTVKHTVLEWQKNAPDDKIIIFTQFVQEGQILGRVLQAEGFSFVYFFGEMTANQRTAAIDTFHEKDEVKIMVASLKCGGVALNLTCANRVILIDPWWNASIEEQAFGRVFRIGQEKETYLQSILVRDTIDKRMHKLQLRKTKMINQTMQYCKGLSVEEMISLIGVTRKDENGNLVVEADYES
ncbi:hypothetical protein PG993_002391 [Apiospora rasikravindrae]|uniref:Uncharacterized protein n=1 Tax=Apiospora rasikravindrae TaxID=990691 RepID=A0ABR1TYR1_9PEZI